jgi:hypothetical protein
MAIKKDLILKASEALEDAADDCHCDTQFYAVERKRPDLYKWCEARSRRYRRLATELIYAVNPKWKKKP